MWSELLLGMSVGGFRMMLGFLMGIYLCIICRLSLCEVLELELSLDCYVVTVRASLLAGMDLGCK